MRRARRIPSATLDDPRAQKPAMPSASSPAHRQPRREVAASLSCARPSILGFRDGWKSAFITEPRPDIFAFTATHFEIVYTYDRQKTVPRAPHAARRNFVCHLAAKIEGNMPSGVAAREDVSPRSLRGPDEVVRIERSRW